MAIWGRGLAVVLLALVSLPAFAGPAEEASAVIDRWAAAYSANDKDAVVRLYTPDAILLGTVSPVINEGPGPIATYFGRLPGSGNKVVIQQRRMMVLGKQAVLGTGFYEFTRVQNGRPVQTPARFSMVVIDRGGGAWMIAHHHSSERPKPQ